MKGGKTQGAYIVTCDAQMVKIDPRVLGGLMSSKECPLMVVCETNWWAVYMVWENDVSEFFQKGQRKEDMEIVVNSESV